MGVRTARGTSCKDRTHSALRVIRSIVGGCRRSPETTTQMRRLVLLLAKLRLLLRTASAKRGPESTIRARMIQVRLLLGRGWRMERSAVRTAGSVLRTAEVSTLSRNGRVLSLVRKLRTQTSAEMGRQLTGRLLLAQVL